ncbi:MAG: hypothetical protein HUJ31_19980 [Pseudomonadales bacterium]|nr:hypothetical protein [Pseudomonadales bacterium]
MEALASTVYVGNTAVLSEGARGRVFDTRVSRGSVRVPIDDEEGADMIFVDAAFDGPLTDGIRVFNETPLAETTGNMAQEWTGTGDVEGQIGLKIPIGDRSGEEVFADVSVSLEGNDLTMPRFDLDVMNISGVVKYDNDAGLSSEPFEAEVLNKAVTGKISSVMGENPGEVIIEVDGSVEVGDLQAWSEQVILTRASGLMNYEAEIHVPYGARSREDSYVLAHSDLQGVTVDLPAPMRKDASERKPLVYKQIFLDPGFRVELSLGDKVNGVLKIVDGVVQGGHVRYGQGKPGAVAFDKIRVSGRLETVNYSRWEEVTDYLESHSDVSLSSELAGRLDAIEVDIGTLNAFGVTIEEAHSIITRKEGRWHVALESELLAGVVKVADGNESPIGVDLDYVRLPATDTTGPEAEDPLADVIPAELVAVDFSTRELSVGEENYGSWSFQLRPDETGAVFQNIEAQVKGLRVVPPSEVAWRRDGDKVESTFKGNVITEDLANALRQWGFASSIEGRNFHFIADVKWAGSPAMISIDTIKGQVVLEDGKGRFVQAERTGPLKMLGIFDFASLSRRLSFDFSDIVDKGFSFEEISGVTRFSGGVINIVDPIEIEGASSIIKVGGTVNLNTRELDNEMIVTLPVNRNLPWYAAYSAIVTGPLMGAGVMLLQKIFENQIDQISSAKYEVTGTLDKPDIKFVSIFTDDMKEIKLQEDDS